MYNKIIIVDFNSILSLIDKLFNLYFCLMFD